MLRNLGLVSLVVLLGLLPIVGCGGGGGEIFENFRFSYRPEFNNYRGGTGLSTSSLAGLWTVRFERAISGGSEILPAVTYTFVAEALTAGKAIAFLPAQEEKGTTYIVLFLNGSDLQIRVFEYIPEGDRVVELTANGNLDLGTGEVAQTQYSAKVFAGSETNGTGLFSASVDFAATSALPTLPNGLIQQPIMDGDPQPVKYVAVDKEGRGDMEIWGAMNLTINGSTLSGTMRVNIVNQENLLITNGQLNVSGTRVGADTNGVFNLVISGNMGGIAWTGTGVLTAIAGPDGPVVNGIVEVESANSGNFVYRARQFSGTIGFTPTDFTEDE